MIIYLNIEVSFIFIKQNVGFLKLVNNLLAILSFCAIMQIINKYR